MHFRKLTWKSKPSPVSMAHHGGLPTSRLVTRRVTPTELIFMRTTGASKADQLGQWPPPHLRKADVLINLHHSWTSFTCVRVYARKPAKGPTNEEAMLSWSVFWYAQVFFAACWGFAACWCLSVCGRSLYICLCFSVRAFFFLVFSLLFFCN